MMQFATKRTVLALHILLVPGLVILWAVKSAAVRESQLYDALFDGMGIWIRGFGVAFLGGVVLLALWVWSRSKTYAYLVLADFSVAVFMIGGVWTPLSDTARMTPGRWVALAVGVVAVLGILAVLAERRMAHRLTRRGPTN